MVLELRTKGDIVHQRIAKISHNENEKHPFSLITSRCTHLFLSYESALRFAFNCGYFCPHCILLLERLSNAQTENISG